MTKDCIKTDLLRFTSGAYMITLTQLQGFLGKSNTYTKDFVRGIDCIGSGKGRMYHVSDIADRIIEYKFMKENV